MIAGTLARNLNDTPGALINTAMELWLSAREKIFTANLMDEIWDQNCEFKRKEEAYHILMEENRHFFPGEEPITRDVFFRTLLPKYKNRADKLAQIAKAFVRETLREKNGKQPSQEDINDAFGKWKPFEEAYQANNMADHFQQWHERHIKESRRAAGLKSAAKKAVITTNQALRSK